MKYGSVKNYIHGQFSDAKATNYIDVVSPVDGTLLSKVPMSGSAELDAAVQSAKTAFITWSKTPIKERVQVFFKYKQLLHQHTEELAWLVVEENGKTYSEAV